MSFNVLVFWVFCLFVFWLGELTQAHAVKEAKKSKVIGETAIAGGSE
jgi:hypothetical protein